MKIFDWDSEEDAGNFFQRISLYWSISINKSWEVKEEVERIFKDIVATTSKKERSGKDRDKKIFSYTQKFDNHQIDEKSIKVTDEELDVAWQEVSQADKDIMQFAKERIENFHNNQKPSTFKFQDNNGVILEQRVRPIQRAGICIPGGRAPLFSTVLMTVIPAKIAGVKEIAMISPWPNGRMNPYILTAANIAKVNDIYKVGGVQGVAALAYGTKSIKKVDKIVGPGNSWVTQAKMLVGSLGLVGIDSPAGSSEIVILADGSCPASYIAADILSQLEHGEDSKMVFITNEKSYAEEVDKELKQQVNSLARKNFLNDSLRDFATAVVTKDDNNMVALINVIAPEHLELAVKNPRYYLKYITNAASIFLGPYSPVPLGDYLAGPNHVLPTERRARFASPLGVEDFMKRQSVVEFTKEALMKLGPAAERMAELEGLDAHAAAIRIRREPSGKNPGRNRSRAGKKAKPA